MYSWWVLVVFFWKLAANGWVGFRPSSRGAIWIQLGWAGIPDVNHVHAGDRLQGNSFAKFLFSRPMGIDGNRIFQGQNLKHLTVLGKTTRNGEALMIRDYLRTPWFFEKGQFFLGRRFFRGVALGGICCNFSWDFLRDAPVLAGRSMVVRLFNMWEWNVALLGLQVGAIWWDSPRVDGEIEYVASLFLWRIHSADAVQSIQNSPKINI